MNPHSLINTRPKRNGHVVRVVHFEPRAEDGPCECSCGAQMAASEFSAHRRAAGATTTHSGQLGVPDMLRGQPNVWARTTTVYCNVTGCDQPVLARAMCGHHYKRWYRARAAAA